MAILAYDDVMLREPRLLVPGMQPLGPVRVDYTNPIAKGCFGALVGRKGCIESRFSPDEFRGAPLFGATYGAQAWQFDGVDDGAICNRQPVLLGKNSNLAVFGVCVFDGASDSNGRWFTIGSSVNTGFGLGTGSTTFDNTGTNFLGLLDGVAWITSTTAVPAGVNTFAWSSPASNSHICYLNGKQVMTSSSTMAAINEAAVGTGVTVHFGCGWINPPSGTNRFSKVALPLFYVFNRSLSAGEIAALHLDPYQLLIPA